MVRQSFTGETTYTGEGFTKGDGFGILHRCGRHPSGDGTWRQSFMRRFSPRRRQPALVFIDAATYSGDGNPNVLHGRVPSGAGSKGHVRAEMVPVDHGVVIARPCLDVPAPEGQNQGGCLASDSSLI